MDNCKTNRDTIKEWCERCLATHTDWTGTRVETKHKCESVEEFIDSLWGHIVNNQWKF